MTIHISPLIVEHIPAIAALAYRIWPSAYADILTQEQIDNLLAAIYNSANLQDEMEKGHRFWGAYAADAMIGFASAYPQGDIIWLRKLYVLPEHQGQGIGKQLMAEAIGAFADARELRLMVNENNIAAQQFYERTGFQKMSQVPVKMGDFEFVDWVYGKVLAL